MKNFLFQLGCMALLVASVYLVILFVVVGPSSANKTSSLALYQRYYNLQRQLDTSGTLGTARGVAFLRQEDAIKKQLSSDSSDIEVHRRLIRTQNERRQSTLTWVTLSLSLKSQMDDIREELEDRGEPPPG